MSPSNQDFFQLCISFYKFTSVDLSDFSQECIPLFLTLGLVCFVLLFKRQHSYLFNMGFCTKRYIVTLAFLIITLLSYILVYKLNVINTVINIEIRKCCMSANETTLYPSYYKCTVTGKSTTFNSEPWTLSKSNILRVRKILL